MKEKSSGCSVGRVTDVGCVQTPGVSPELLLSHFHLF